MDGGVAAGWAYDSAIGGWLELIGYCIVKPSGRSNMSRQYFCACALFCVSVITSAAVAELYHVTDLGALPSNYNTSSGSAINNFGSVSGSSATLGLYSHAFYWSPGGGIV